MLSRELRLETLYLELTNRCNISCPSCPRTCFFSTKAPRDLSLDTVRTILDQIPRGIRIVEHGLGEPLLNPQVVGITALCKTYDHRVIFNSNVTLLDRAMAEGLVKAGLDELRISVETPDADSYHNVRPGSDFDLVMNNVQSAIEVKRRLHSDTPRLSFWMTAARSRLVLLPELLRLAARVGVPEVYLQRLVTFGRGTAVGGESIFGKRDGGWAKILCESEKLSRELGVRLWSSGDTKPTGAHLPLPRRPWSQCYRPFRNAYIQADGNFLPCCITPFSMGPMREQLGPNLEKLFLGNIFSQSFAEVWRGRRYEAFRNAFDSDNPWPCCSRCGTDWSL
ncbi:MAG TPA: radical SAM protein [Spirochaetia bacterium]|nr:radical SAM protein [Spirochaetia bacterium]